MRLSVCLPELIIWCKMVFQNLDTGVTGKNVNWSVHIQSPSMATFDSTWKIVFYLHFSSQSCKMHNAQNQLFLIFSDNKANIFFFFSIELSGQDNQNCLKVSAFWIFKASAGVFDLQRAMLTQTHTLEKKKCIPRMFGHCVIKPWELRSLV